ncbi:MAG: uroporphyrinogen decarboxylase family protein [Anaerolineae bacterium]
MNKRERLEKTISGEVVDRVPVALWRHFPGDDQRAADLARSVIEFQKSYDWDFVKVTPASNHSVADYGVQDEWRGSIEGTREVTRRIIRKSLDWTELRPLDPARGELAKYLEALRLVGEGLNDGETPIIATIFNPLSQAKHLAGNDMLLRHLRTNADRLKSALNVLTENTLRLIEALKRTSISGIFYAVQHASYDLLSEEEYRSFGLPYDRKILESLPPKWWLNVMHLHGQSPMFKLCSDYPVQVVNWHDRETEPDLALGKTLIRGAVCGGLSQWADLHQATPSAIRETIREAVNTTNGRRFILSTGCVSLITTPFSNLRAVRQSVESI